MRVQAYVEMGVHAVRAFVRVLKMCLGGCVERDEDEEDEEGGDEQERAEGGEVGIGAPAG